MSKDKSGEKMQRYFKSWFLNFANFKKTFETGRKREPFEAGDVLLSVDEVPVAEDGSVPFRDAERIGRGGTSGAGAVGAERFFFFFFCNVFFLCFSCFT